MNEDIQELKTEILKLLFASTWQSKEVLISYQRFVSLVCDFAKRFHSERPMFSAVLTDTEETIERIIEDLVADDQFDIRRNSRNEIITIEYKGYYLTATNHWYRRIRSDIDAPFPSTQILKATIPLHLHMQIPIHELRNQYHSLRKEDSLILLQFSDNLHEIMVSSELLRKDLLSLCLSKISKYILEQKLTDEILKQINPPGENLDLDLKKRLQAFQNNPTEEIQWITQGDEMTLALWESIKTVVEKDSRSGIIVNQGAEAQFQALLITYEIILSYREITVQKETEQRKEEILVDVLSNEPYAFTFTDMQDAYEKKLKEHTIPPGNPGELHSMVQLFTKGTPQQELPNIISFDGLDGNEYYALTLSLPEIYIPQLREMRKDFRKYYHNCYSKSLKEGTHYPFIGDPEALEYELEARLRSKFPRLYTLLHANTINKSIGQSKKYLPEFIGSEQEAMLEELLEKHTQTLQSYSSICEIDNEKMNENVKKTLPFWIMIPLLGYIIRSIIKLFARFLKKEQGRSKKGVGGSSSTKSVISNMSLAESDNSLKEETFDTNDNLVEKPKATPAISPETAAIIAELQEFMGSEEATQKNLADYLRLWNLVSTEPARTNLTKDVNSLCRDTIRKLFRKKSKKILNLERINNLSEQISEDKVFNQISNKRALKQYLILYITMHILSITKP